MNEPEYELLCKVLDDIPQPYECTTCGKVWVVSGRPCTCESKARPVNMRELRASFDEAHEEMRYPNSCRDED